MLPVGLYVRRYASSNRAWLDVMHLYNCSGDASFVPDGAHCISLSPAGRWGHIYPPYSV